jgi:hypothetical protein
MSEKLPIAIEAIKAGNKQLGQQLLAQILQADPNNEQAWLWMSAVVDEDKRKYCIERVLKINPNNILASQALSELNQKKNISKPQIEYSPPIAQTPPPNPTSKATLNIEDEPKPSLTFTAIKDGFTIGLLGGIIGIVFAFIFRFVFDSPPLAAATIFGTCIAANITTGITFFRRRIGSNLRASYGGFVSGFVSGAITSLGYGAVSLTAPIIIYLSFCGLFIPFFYAVIGSIIIWIPRLFINPSPINSEENLAPKKQKSLEAPLTPHISSPISHEKPVTRKSIEVNPVHSPIEEKPAMPIEDSRSWVSSNRSNTFVFSLTGNDLQIASAPIRSLQNIKNSVLQSESPDQFLTDKENIPYQNITKVRQILSTIRIYYTNGSKETSRALDCQDAKMGDEIVSYLRKHLHSRFDETNKPIGTGMSLFFSGVVMLIIFAGTAFFYYGAYEIEAGIISPRGSARTRALINLLDLLGTNGVLVVGAILFLLSLGLMFYLLKNPPTVTEFIRKSSQKIEEAPQIPLQMEHPKNTALSKPEEVIPITPQVATGAVLIDGLLSGLILGGIGIILPGISIFTNDQQLARSGMYLDGLLILFSGVLTGILFQGRNIGKNQSIVLGGTIAGALTGLLTGMALGLSPQNRTITNMVTQDGPKIYMMVCMIYPSIGGAIIGALSAWMFGLTSKEAKVTKNDDPLVQTTLTAQPNTSSSQNDTVGSRFAKMFTRRLVLAAIFVAIIFICTLCQSLTSSL